MSYLSEVLADTPAVYFRLGDSSGTAMADSSGNARTGAYVNAPTKSVAGALSGDTDTAVTFTRTSSQYATFPTTGLPSGSSAYTLEVWAKPATIDSNQGLLSIGNFGSGGQSNALRLGGSASAPQVVHYWWGNDLAVDVNPATVAAGAWVHVVATWDGTYRKIYLNGKLVGGDRPSAPNVVLTSPTVGRTQSGELFNGSLDEAAVYATALSQSRIRAHYVAGGGSVYATYNDAIMTDAPIGYFRLGETTGTAPFDSSIHWTGISINGTMARVAGLVAGDPDGAFDFDGTQNYVNVASGGPGTTHESFTVESLLRVDVGGKNQHIIGRADEAAGNVMFKLLVSSANKAQLVVKRGATTYTVTGTSTLTVGSAYHVAGAFDSTAGTITIYVNGAAEGTVSGITGTWGVQPGILLGAGYNGSIYNRFDGVLDEIAYFPAALSGVRIAAHYVASLGSSITGTIAGTLPALTGSAAGTVTQTVSGAVAGTLPSLSGVVTGNAVTTGASNGILPALTGAASGTVAGLTTGTVAGSLPSLTGSATGNVAGPTTGTVAGTLPALTGNVTDAISGAASIAVGVKVETGALTLLKLKALPGVEVAVGLGGITTGTAQSVVPLPGVSIEIGCSLIGRQSDVIAPDPRRRATQWRYVVTDLANTPLGELVDIEHDAVEDGVGEPATMSFTIATDSPECALIKPIERQCQVWDGNRLLLRGPILPGQPSDDGTTITHKVHDPSWFWRDGRRVITRTPQRNYLHNGDFRDGLAYWSRGYDRQSKPAAAPNVRVVSEDFVDDTDGLDPIKAAEITGVESYTESELSSNAVFWPNLATFRPGGEASVEAVANGMPETAGLKVTVIGHTANDGTGDGMGLSLRRANAAAAIIKKKRPGAIIATKGVGYYDPKPGFPIGSQAQRRVVIQYDQTISGESLQWMRQRVEVTQPKEARYPLVLTAAAMLKVADDWSIEDANMMSVKVLARRKVGAKPPKSVADALTAAKADLAAAMTHLSEVQADKDHTADQLDSARADVTDAQAKVADAQNEADSAPWDLQLGVGSASISDTDPVDRWIPQTAEVTIPADGRVYVVDVYLYAPAALARYTAVGLFPDEMLYFWGVDQASIFRGIMQHIQKPEFGYADLGVGTRTLATGIKRDREFAYRDLTPADTALDGLMGISRGIEWDTVTTATTTTATTYYPRQGKSVDYVLALGSNIVTAVPANTRDVGSAIIAQAQGLGSYRAVAYASDARAFGGTLIQRVVTAEQDAPLNELRETAKAELFWARSSTPAYWVDVDPDSVAEVLAETAKGDTVRLILDHPEAVDRLVRIVRRQIHPDSLRLMVAFEEV